MVKRKRKGRVNVKPKIFRILGAILFLIGIVLILNSFLGMTGFVVADSISGGFSSILGLMFVIGGALLFMGGGRGLEDQVNIYKYPHKKGDESYYLDDSENLFGSTGIVGFKDFLKETKEIKEDKELLGDVRRAYVPSLNRYIDEGGEYSVIAKKCLETLQLKVEEVGEDNEKDSYVQEIKLAFKDWDGKLTPKRREVLKKGGLKYIAKKGKHPSIVHEDNSRIKITLADTPGDTRRGNKNLTQDIIRLYTDIKKKNQGKP